jgi:pyridoxamine 5'-phosphate oxidase
MATWTDERSLDEADLDAQPYRQLLKWCAEAREAGEPLPNALTLATVGADGRPSARMVLFEDISERGVTFQTNRASPKARDLAVTPYAALVFFWPSLLRQVRVTGRVEELSRSEAASYFDRESRAIKVMLRACRQSTIVRDRSELEAQYAAASGHADEQLELPEHWGAYRVGLEQVEFFQGRQNWLQDRLRYSLLGDGGWRIERLVP